MKIIENIVATSVIRVILTLAVGIFIGIKFPEGVKITCTLAETLNQNIELCNTKDGNL